MSDRLVENYRFVLFCFFPPQVNHNAKNTLATICKRKAAIVKRALVKPCRVNRVTGSLRFIGPIPVSFALVRQIVLLPAKHFLPLAHSSKQLAAIVPGPDQRQKARQSYTICP